MKYVAQCQFVVKHYSTTSDYFISITIVITRNLEFEDIITYYSIGKQEIAVSQFKKKLEMKQLIVQNRSLYYSVNNSKPNQKL